MMFKGKVLLFVKDKNNCFHLYKKHSKAPAELETYIDYIETLEEKNEIKIVQAFVLNNEDHGPKYVWSLNPFVRQFNKKPSFHHQKYLDYLKKNHLNLTFHGPYRSKDSKGLHVCEKGHEWVVSPNKVIKGEVCPLCKKKDRARSSGEKLIASFLEEKGVHFRRETSLKFFGHERDLKLDFIICKNKYPLFAIEYQGVQHFTPIRNEFFGGYEKFKKRKNRDRIKKYFCWNIGVPTIEIPYTESEQQTLDTIRYFLELYEVIDHH